MKEQEIRGAVRKELILEATQQFSDSFTVDIFLARQYYKKVAETILEGVRSAVGDLAVTRNKALRGSYHIEFSGYNRSDLEVQCEIAVMGPIDGKNIIDLSAEEPRGGSSGEESFSVSETPNEAVQSSIEFFKTNFGVR